jgi:hypothetical protein
MGAETQNGGPPTPGFILESWGEIHMVKDNGSGWLVTKQGGVTLPNHTQSYLQPTQVREIKGVL